MTDALRNLPEASYDGLAFPVERLDWTGGNDLVEHVAYRRPGADVEPTGRKAYRGTMVLPLINTPALVARYGELFPGLRYDLLRKFEERPIATLMHPTLGQITAAIGDVSESAEASDRGGVRLTVGFVEHDASVALLIGTDSAATPTNASQSATELARTADDANKSTAGYTATLPIVQRETAFLTSAPRAYTVTQASLRAMLQPVEANLALSSVSPASAHAAFIASANLRAAIYALRDRLIPTPEKSSVYTTPREMADWEIAEAVYGDASLVQLLRSANSIASPLAIPAGRTLIILPRPGV